MIELLTANHFDKIMDLFSGAKSEIKIVSPFLTMSMADLLCKAVKDKGAQCTFITRFYLEDMLAKANSMDALELLMKNGVEVLLAKKLHTKLYLFDSHQAILGSANFTNGGFKSNIELSILATDETALIAEMSNYFDGMANKLRLDSQGTLKPDMIMEGRKRYESLFSSQLGKGKVKTMSTLMFGAIINPKDAMTTTNEHIDEIKKCENESDIVSTMFKQTEASDLIKYDYTIWLKFDGEGDNRLAASEPMPMISVVRKGKTLYLNNYPFKVESINDGDHFYLAALSTDKFGKNQPMIVGRGVLNGFSEENHVDDDMIAQYGWMSRFPWYCIIKECTVLDTSVNNGIQMNSVWDALGSDTYMASFGKHEDIAAVGRKHYQKAHIRLTGNAAKFIDAEFDKKAKEFGTILYKSEE